MRHLNTMRVQEDLARRQAENARWTVRLAVAAIVTSILTAALTTLFTTLLGSKQPLIVYT